MIKWFRRSQEETQEKNAPSEASITPVVGVTEEQESILEERNIKENFFTRLRKSLTKTRTQLGEGVARLLLGKKEINQDLLDELESLLVSADLGIDTTQLLLKQLTQSMERKHLNNGDALFENLKEQLEEILERKNKPLSPTTADGSPFVILMIGVNGAGKTTTIGKLAKQFQQQGKKVMLAAGDTFRAAAVEQLQAWGARNEIPVIAQHTGADSASVIFDALQAAKARKIDILIADTAGRLHTQDNLMEELKKVKRVLQKLNPEAPHETMLVLDAGIGQNALVQARQFHDAIQVSGITMTKLDGTAKGGILFAVANELEIPFRFIGVGEGIEDLRPFDAKQFVEALFS
ncbi:MAG: signal recognition particle-docking protein FtsY [Legionella sp. 40-6]|nr:signal recognition particle-docking protein FtsY [Legionella sp.]OJY24856.1 MAG: signal recognition particle-docking protein FtsY [Legionella sp. 40-6]